MNTQLRLVFGFVLLLSSTFAFAQGEPLSQKNQTLGRNFLKKNQTQPDVHTLPSGLQYKIVEEGKGNSPGPTDFVTVNYRGTFIDGTEFDSSYARNEPATFAVNAVIQGWSEAIQLMKPNAKWTLYIPENLAYGEQGAGHVIGPNSTLIFDVELLSVQSTDHNAFIDDLEENG